MRNISRFGMLVSSGVIAATLAACASRPAAPAVATYPAPYSVATAPATTAPAAVEYGRVSNIEYVPVGTSAPQSPSVLGAIVGGVAGAALGHQIGRGGGRTAATVLGGAAGAVAGNQIARNSQGVTTSAGYRVTVQTDQGATRVYEVSSTGDLRVGDRVRVDNGVIYRS